MLTEPFPTPSYKAQDYYSIYTSSNCETKDSLCKMAETIKFSSSMGLSGLLHEPIRLNAEADKCNDELEDLVMANYRIFVENLTCSVELRKEDQKLNKVSAELNERLEKLAGYCSSFREKVSTLVSSHKRNRKTLQHHMQLVELLEVPQLVDACARNDFLDEALELANFVNGLERRHLLAEGLKSNESVSRQADADAASPAENADGAEGEHPRVGVVSSIVLDVRRSLLALRGQLITQLSQHASLPKALSTLATLRKLDGILIDQQMARTRHAHVGLGGTAASHGRGRDSSANKNPNALGNSITMTATEFSEEQRDALRACLVRSCETRLQMEFLEGRSNWIHAHAGEAGSVGIDAGASREDESGSSSSSAAEKASALSPGLAAPSSSASLGPYGKALEMLEAARTSWFTVVTQYNAVFGTMDSSSMSSSSSGSGSGSAGASANVNGTYPSTSILSAWVSAQVGALLRDLEDLCHGVDEGAALRAILEQSLFFGQRMAQVGCNFNAVLVPLFERIIVERISVLVGDAVRHVKHILDTERYNPAQAAASNSLSASELSGGHEQVVPLFVRKSGEGETAKELLTPAGNSKKVAAKDIPAPNVLASYPPLVFWVNSLLSSLNLLRECPIMSARSLVSDTFREAMLNICEYLVSTSSQLRAKGAKYLSSTGATAPIAGEKHTAQSPDCLDRMYARTVAQDLLPHSLFCLDSIFDETANMREEKEKDTAARNNDKDLVTPAKASQTNYSHTRTLHVERLLDAQALLSKESFKTLQMCWTLLGDAGLVADSPYTPSPLPPQQQARHVV